MDLEETKKIIQNKIEADESTREVRSQIKSYIDQKQNLREGFKETFKPLIETSEAVKTSIDTQQSKLIKQLQDNQLSLTAGLEGNRKAITSGFDKMDEVKRWDLQQLPGFEAIEEPEKESEETETKTEEGKKTSIPKDEDNFIIEGKDYNKLFGEKIHSDDQQIVMSFKDINYLYNVSSMDKNRYKLKYDIIRRKAYLKDMKPLTTVEYSEDEMNKHLTNKKTVEILDNFGLKLPIEYRNKSMEELQEAFVKGMEVAANLKRKIKNVAKYEKDTDTYSKGLCR